MQPYYVQHRVNTVADLERAPSSGGVEIDLRSDVRRPHAMHLSHDPWTLGEDFETWLGAYARLGFAGPLILNTKEDGLEETILNHLQTAGIEHFFFLDTTPPTLVRLLAAGLGAHVCLRVSAWESAQAAEVWLASSSPHHRPAWVWLDCFGGEAMPTGAASSLLQDYPELKICLVSPELQRAPVSRIQHFLPLGSMSAAVCTKRPDVWNQAMEAREP